jgi:membrane protease YdiL (CAAX protease family)
VNAFVRRRPLLSYFMLAYAITWTVAAPLLLSGRGFIDTHPLEWLEPLAAFGPFIAAMLVARALQGRAGPAEILSSLTRWRVRPVWFVFALGSPVLILSAAFLLVNLTGGQPIDPARGRLGELASAAGLVDLIVVSAVVQAWGEEPGWRGFALPQLRERFGSLLATLALFPVWLCWHLPFFLSRPGFGLAQWLGFSLGILSAAIWLTMIWDRSRSVLMCLGWHAMVNICRSLALAMSTVMFLAFSNTVLFGGVVIASYWLLAPKARIDA